METYDPRIDAYLDKAQPFAVPILTHLRELIHKACPQVRETIKWGMPFFDYQGTLCHIASFKQHAILGFWKGTLLSDPAGKMVVGEGENVAMGHLGKLTTLKDLPSDKVIIGYIHEAMRLNEQGIKVDLGRRKSAGPKVEEEAPDYLKEVLKNHPSVQENWTAFPPSHRKEYIRWIVEAKTEATRQKRISTLLEWVAEHKHRNWKYDQ